MNRGCVNVQSNRGCVNVQSKQTFFSAGQVIRGEATIDEQDEPVEVL